MCISEKRDELILKSSDTQLANLLPLPPNFKKNERLSSFQRDVMSCSI